MNLYYIYMHVYFCTYNKRSSKIYIYIHMKIYIMRERDECECVRDVYCGILVKR